ncbi:MAG: radical SAM protein [Candidatus Pacearchaeota archaeon]|jgi:MoaA/NifB/PqqE/SkfB family radical SAM enzyme
MNKIKNLDINFQIDHFCNYDCHYCQIPSFDKKNKNKHISPEIIKEFFKNIYESNIILSGGEPFLFPEFLNICQLLIKNNNNIVIYTNLSSDLIFEFANKLDPKKVSNIRASLHLTELKKFNSKDKFIERYNYLIKKGFHVEVPIVMWPPIFKNFENIYKEFVSYGIYLIPLSFFGKYKEKDYPENYTKKELETIKKYFEKTNKHFKGNYSNPTEISKSKISYKGNLCLTGIKFIAIFPDGTIRRCYTDEESLGNLKDNKLKLFSKVMLCTSEYCTCPGVGNFYCLNKNKKKENIFSSIIKKILN